MIFYSSNKALSIEQAYKAASHTSQQKTTDRNGVTPKSFCLTSGGHVIIQDFVLSIPV